MRLTERDEYGNADIIALSDIMPELYAELSYAETNALTDALNRLADYEDTGLEPEQIVSKLELAKKEWDAAVRDLRGDCGVCARSEECGTYPNYCINGNRWQWRGVKGADDVH